MNDKLRGDILVFFSSVMVNVSFIDILLILVASKREGENFF